MASSLARWGHMQLIFTVGHIKGKTVYSSNYPESEGKLSEYSVQFQQHNFDLQ
jgi:hypothetical protein